MNELFTGLTKTTKYSTNPSKSAWRSLQPSAHRSAILYTFHKMLIRGSWGHWAWFPCAFIDWCVCANCSGWLLLHWEPLNWVNSILFSPEILPRAPEAKSQLHLTSHWPIYSSLSGNETKGTCRVWRTCLWKYSVCT